MALTIPDEVLHAAQLGAAELSQEIAVLLFEQRRLSLGQASGLAGMRPLQFQELLASREIPIHYDVAEFEADLETLDVLR